VPCIMLQSLVTLSADITCLVDDGEDVIISHQVIMMPTEWLLVQTHACVKVVNYIGQREICTGINGT
jgi:hypothetical protein